MWSERRKEVILRKGEEKRRVEEEDFNFQWRRFYLNQCWDFSVINREIGYFLEEDLGYFASRLFLGYLIEGKT